MCKTPCESTPRRFAQMSDFAHSSAMAGATPTATNSARAKRSRSALEITCDPVFDGIGTLQQRSRRANSPDLYTKALAEQQSRIALPRAWAIRAMVGLCRPTANGTMRASARNARRAIRFPQPREGHDRRNPFRRAADCRLELPAAVGDYTDFFAGIHHATNAGRLFRPDNPLLPNYKYVPIGYHGRASSIRPSGADLRRPNGQHKGATETAPSFGP